jgi:hypothetical protein
MEYTNNQITSNDQLQMALQCIRKAVQGKREDELFYDILLVKHQQTKKRK